MVVDLFFRIPRWGEGGQDPQCADVSDFVMGKTGLKLVTASGILMEAVKVRGTK